MNSEESPPQQGGISVNPQHVVDVLKYCVREYLVANDLDTQQAEQLAIDDFVSWCLQEGLPINARGEICGVAYSGEGLQPEGSRIPETVVIAIWNQLQNPYAAVKMLWPIWEWLVLKRPPFKPRLREFQISINMGFRDGKALEVRLPSVMEDKPITEGFLCSLIKSQLLSVIQIILENGIEAMHEKYAIPVGVPPTATKAPDVPPPDMGVTGD